MDLQYMQKLKDWDESKNWKNTGIDFTVVNEIQYKYNIIFPLVYQEFLFVSGAYCPAIVQGHRFEFIEEKQQQAQKLLKEFKLSYLIKKPFWVIATDANAFWYFHLDEGDNPPVYRLDCEYYGDMEDEYTFGKVAASFQAWIEKGIEYYEMDPENK